MNLINQMITNFQFNKNDFNYLNKIMVEKLDEEFQLGEILEFFKNYKNNY